MAASSHDRVSERLLGDWQRNFPLEPRPFLAIANELGLAETEVIERLKALRDAGVIDRVGGVVRPNTIGASTLAAVAVPDFEVEPVAALLSAEPGVNHVYLRENDWNLWFVVTGPDRRYVDTALKRLADCAGYNVLDLSLETPYFIDLGFALTGAESGKPKYPRGDQSVRSDYSPGPEDRILVQKLTSGLPLAPEPFSLLAADLGMTQADVLDRLRALTAARIVPRIGVIVRHRSIGWRANAMVTWDVPPADVDRAGAALAGARGVNLCYRRRRHEQAWPYNLYCMVHAKTREDALEKIAGAQERARLSSHPRQILFSLRCYKQTGALVTRPWEAA
jgi:DNA-binding Lrp family transcriptional regulator